MKKEKKFQNIEYCWSNDFYEKDKEHRRRLD
jgi:hypothetical protein